MKKHKAKRELERVSRATDAILKGFQNAEMRKEAKASVALDDGTHTFEDESVSNRKESYWESEEKYLTKTKPTKEGGYEEGYLLGCLAQFLADRAQNEKEMKEILIKVEKILNSRDWIVISNGRSTDYIDEIQFEISIEKLKARIREEIK